jgi:hypothetical protein
LRHAVPVAQVDEQPAAMVAVAVDPAAQSNFFPDMLTAQLAARMSSQHNDPRDKKTRSTGNPAIVMGRPNMR